MGRLKKKKFSGENLGLIDKKLEKNKKDSIRISAIISAPSPYIIRVTELRRMRYTGNVACMLKMKIFLNIYSENWMEENTWRTHALMNVLQ
jgi:hypothetical protein